MLKKPACQPVCSAIQAEAVTCGAELLEPRSSCQNHFGRIDIPVRLPITREVNAFGNAHNLSSPERRESARATSGMSRDSGGLHWGHDDDCPFP